MIQINTTSINVVGQVFNTMTQDKAESSRIRRLAGKQGLKATSRTRNDGYNSRVRLWWFSNENNMLQSYEPGLDDQEALFFLQTDELIAM